MNTSVADPKQYPTVVSSNSLYMKDSSVNKDAEYHMQVVEISDGAFVVNYQFGRRGAKLTHGAHSKGAILSRFSAMRAKDDHIQSKIIKGYMPIDLSSLKPIYEHIMAGGLDQAKVDVYMHRDRKDISMLEYLKNAGDGAGDHIIAAYAFAAKATMTGVLSKIGRAAPIDQQAYQDASNQSLALLRQSKMADFGIFIGHKNAEGVIVSGIPPAPQAAKAEVETEKSLISSRRLSM